MRTGWQCANRVAVCEQGGNIEHEQGGTIVCEQGGNVCEQGGNI